MARADMTSACRSRWRTWFETGAGASLRCLRAMTSTRGSRWMYVPTEPDIRPTEMTSRACSSRVMFLLISSYQTRTLKPKVTGSAWTPWVRPMQTVFLYLMACFLSRALSVRRSLRTISMDFRIRRDRAVSTTSYEVRPRWM